MSASMEARRNRAVQLRYKKAMVNGLTFWQIRNSLEEMNEACDDVIYWMDSDEQTLIDALEGDGEDADRFKIDFSQLSADIDRMYDDMLQIDEPDRFDDIMVVSGIGDSPGYEILGYDILEEDYFGINPFLHEYAKKESVKRLERLTKKELLNTMRQVMCIVFAYQGIQSRYQDLKSAIDILRGKNKEYLEGVKKINELYDSIDWSDRWVEYSKGYEALDRIFEKLPQEAWL